MTANFQGANNNLPSADSTAQTVAGSFANQGLSQLDMVALAGTSYNFLCMKYLSGPVCRVTGGLDRWVGQQGKIFQNFEDPNEFQRELRSNDWMIRWRLDR